MDWIDIPGIVQTVHSPLFSCIFISSYSRIESRENWTPAQNGRLDRVGGGDREKQRGCRHVRVRKWSRTGNDPILDRKWSRSKNNKTHVLSFYKKISTVAVLFFEGYRLFSLSHNKKNDKSKTNQWKKLRNCDVRYRRQLNETLLQVLGLCISPNFRYSS